VFNNDKNTGETNLINVESYTAITNFLYLDMFNIMLKMILSMEGEENKSKQNEDNQKIDKINKKASKANDFLLGFTNKIISAGNN